MWSERAPSTKTISEDAKALERGRAALPACTRCRTSQRRSLFRGCGCVELGSLGAGSGRTGLSAPRPILLLLLGGAPAEEKAKRPPSGFAKPTLISDELCGFLGKPIGTQVARTEVTKYLSVYIKQNNLQDAINKKVIHPDAKLKALLDCDELYDESTELTFWSINKFMKPHFKK